MDGSLPIYVLVLIVLIALSAFFSASETAFASYNKMRMKSEAEDKTGRPARRVLNLAENYEKLISTILIGNNIVNIVATSIATILFTHLLPGNEAAAATISTVVMTLAVLIFGEITPKTVAKRTADNFAKRVVGTLEFLVSVFTPFTFLFNLWQRFVLRFLKTDEEVSVTEEEIITVVEEAASDGEIDEQESELIKNVIKFSDLDVNDILTPRVDVAAVDITWDRERVASVFADTEFSRLPVYEENVDSIVGILYQKDFHNNADTPISELVKPVKFIFSSMKISRLLKLFQDSKCHMVIVNDEYGGTEGLVTLEDVIESLVGEIYDEHDEVVEEIVQISENRYRVLGSTSIDKFLETFELELEEEDDDSDITTVSGFAAHNLEKIPDEGDSFEHENLKITITKTDSNRVLEAVIDVFEKETQSEE
ncbi:MAG: HlyC/CorC family transporter [Ruminococcaceae bacterium]|nr:HlyC/CorC family transporter [Oscillospiraceae bacterium]